MIWNIDSHPTSFLRFTTEIEKKRQNNLGKKNEKKEGNSSYKFAYEIKFYSNEILIYRHDIE